MRKASANRTSRPRLAMLALALLVPGVLGAQCGSKALIANFDPQTGYIEVSQSGYAVLLGCANGQANHTYRWEITRANGFPLDAVFYDVGASTNGSGVLVDEKFTGNERPHSCWQPVDLSAAGVLDFSNPGPPPHGYVSLTLNGDVSTRRSHPFRIATTRPQSIRLLATDGYMAWLDPPYRRWFRGDEVIEDLLTERSIDPSPLVWFLGFNKPEQWWAGNNGFFTKSLSDGRNLQDAVAEAFAAVDAHNASAPASEQIPRGWFGVAFDRFDLARKRNADLCCIDDGTGQCSSASVTSPTLDFPGCGGPYGSQGGALEWCGLDGVGGVGTSTCHEADGSYGGLEGIQNPDGSMGLPDALTADLLSYVEKSWVDTQDDLYGVVDPPCTAGEFRDFDKDWYCGAYGSMRCIGGPNAGDACSADADCRAGRCREAVPLFYGTVERGPYGTPPRCNNPYGFCIDNLGQSCESNADCGGQTCVMGQEQGACLRHVGTGVGIWDRRDARLRETLIGMGIHILKDAFLLAPGTGRDHFSITLGGEGLIYEDRGPSCRGDRVGCPALDSNDNSFGHRDHQFATARVGDLRMHYRNPQKAGEAEYFDSRFYQEFKKALRDEGYSDEAFLLYHGAKYAPIQAATNTYNRLWWMNEPARQSLRSDGLGNVVQSQPATFAAGLNQQAPEARPDSMGYAFRSGQVIRLAARHNSIDDGRPTFGVDHAQGALWSLWSIDPDSNPAQNCPGARFQGPGARGVGISATCSTQSPNCEVGSDGFCPESERDVCTIDPSQSNWGSCRSLVVSVFDYDNRTSGVCSENAAKRCLSSVDCFGTCLSDPAVGGANVGIPVALVDVDEAALGALNGTVEMDFRGPGCTDSEGPNVATYVGDPLRANCDVSSGLLDVGGLAHVEVLDQANPPFAVDETVVLGGRFRRQGSTGGTAVGPKLGFGHVSGEGWGESAAFDVTDPVPRSAAVRNGPQLWFDAGGISLSCVDRLSGSIPVASGEEVQFEIVWDRAGERATLDAKGVRRSCKMPPADGNVGGFALTPVVPDEGGQRLPYNITWFELSLYAP